MSSFRVASELLVVESVVGLDVVVLVDAVVEPIFAALFSPEDGQKKKISRKSIKIYRQCVPRRRRNRGRRDLATLFAQVVVIGITVDFLRECKNLALCHSKYSITFSLHICVRYPYFCASDFHFETAAFDFSLFKISERDFRV